MSKKGENLAREMDEESQKGILQHKKIVDFLKANFGEDTIPHSSIVLVTHTPLGLYQVDFVGNLHKDELYYGLGIAKKLII